MALFAETKAPFLRGFLRLPGGLPSHDTFSQLFRRLDPDQFRAVFQRFMASFSETCQGGDYTLPVKGNQGTMLDDVTLFFSDPGRAPGETAKTVDADHGRIETRMAEVCIDIAWLQEDHRWPGLAAIGKIVRTR